MRKLDRDLYADFLQLVRLGIGTSNDGRISNKTDWARMKALADEQGLSAVVLDALNAGGNHLTMTMPLQMKLEWIGKVLQNYEQRYVTYEKAISSLAGFYNQHWFKMMVVKGYACSVDWPKPNHRPCGDIDIWQFGQWKEANNAIAEEKGIKIDNSHHHHTLFDWHGFTVENHYDFIEVHHHKSNPKFEEILKELAKDDTYVVVLDGEKVYFPSPNLHALFLLKHAMSHFAAEVFTFRQLLDWAFFVQKHTNEINWSWIEQILEEYGMKKLYDVFNAICVGDLGFDVHIFPKVQFDPALKDRVLNEMLSPEFSETEPKGLISRVMFKYRRWKANEWKHKLCYKESMWSAFWSGTWNHLLKPSSI